MDLFHRYKVQHTPSGAVVIFLKLFLIQQLVGKLYHLPCVVAVIIIYKIFTRIQSVDVPNKVRAIKEFVAPSEGPRFRKRDKIAFVMNKVKRNSIATAQFIRGGE